MAEKLEASDLALDLDRLADIEQSYGNERDKFVYHVALEYIRLGWPVIPIEFGGKTLPSRNTLFKRGITKTLTYADASTVRERIDEWFNPTNGIFRGFNLAIVCGSTVSALDLDLKAGVDGYKEYMDRVGAMPSRTPSQRTPSGGYHFLFQHAPGFRTKQSVFNGVDTRGCKRSTGEPGSHIVVYPSVITDKDGGQNMYRWTSGGSPAPAPQELLDCLNKAKDINPHRPPQGTGRGNEQVDEEDYFPDATLEDVRKALECIDITKSDKGEYDTWVDIGMAIHSQWDGMEGFELFHEWSKTQAGYVSEKDCWGKWSTFNSEDDTGITINTLFWYARKGGYRKEGNLSPDLLSNLRRSDKGGILNTNHNLWVILQSEEFAKHFGGHLTYDTFQGEVRAGDTLFVNEKYTQIAQWLSTTFMLERGKDSCRDFARMVAVENKYDSLTKWAEDLRWDGTSRIEELAVKLNAQNDYQKVAVRRWLIGGIARALRPGCTSTHMLILFGAQGIGKSRFFRTICPVADWFSDSTIFKFSRDTSHRDEELKLQGKFLVEVAELAGIWKSDFNDLKSFLDKPVGTVRRPYDTDAIDLPRRCIFGGSTNVDQIIADTTGGRRFAFLSLGENKIDIEWVAKNRDQIWAEAKALYDKGDAWWFNEEEFEEQTRENRNFEREHPWKDLIMDWACDKSRFSNEDIFDFVLKMPAEKRTQAHMAQLKGILEQEGWKRVTSKVAGQDTKPRLWKNPDTAVDNRFSGKRWLPTNHVDDKEF